MSLIHSTQDPQHLILSPQENLLASTCQQYREAFREHTQSPPPAVSVDLSKVTIMDSSGIGLLIALYNSLKARSSEFSIIHASPDIHDLLTSMGLDEHFVIQSTADAT